MIYVLTYKELNFTTKTENFYKTSIFILNFLGYAELFTYKMDFGLQNLKQNARSSIQS